MAAAKELPQLSLIDALELTMLIARKDSRRYPRVAARWLERLLREHPDATIRTEAAMGASWSRRSRGRSLPGRGADASSHGRKGD